MASPDPGIKDGISLPVWMKNKPTVEFEPYAASPPGAEDSFFYIPRYPKHEAFTKPHTEPGPILSGVRDKTWHTHTKANQLMPVQQINPPVNIIKTTGSDGGSDNSDSKSHQMLSAASRSVSSRGFTVATPEEEEPTPSPHRRGSRSLPSSPLSSRRHRYFTPTFSPKDDVVQGRSWLTSALLGFKKEQLPEEEDLRIDTVSGGSSSLAQSVENLGPLPRKSASFRPKPSELREMNFWSPTSIII